MSEVAAQPGYVQPAPTCCEPTCGKLATFGVIADNAPPTPDNIGETQACDDHLVEIGLMHLVGHPEAHHWRVWRL